MEEKTITFTNIGVNDKIPYAKADIVKVCRLGQNYSLSFYQVDYQAVAVSIAQQSPLDPGEQRPIPVSKIVLDKLGFKMLIDELGQIQASIASESRSESKAGKNE